MPSIINLHFLASATLCLAAPTNFTLNGFQVHQVPNGQVLKSGPRDALRTYRKYGLTPPSYLEKAAASFQEGSVSAYPDSYESSYLCPVQVGNNKLNLDFDTGSSDLWVFSTLTPSTMRNGQATYNPFTGRRLPGYTWHIGYADGSGASGKVYSDRVAVGGVTATSMAVEAATSVSGSFARLTNTDGLLGLAFSSINTIKPYPQKTFFDKIKNTLPQPLFTATLRHNAPGVYDFGFVDEEKYTGSLSYVPVDSSEGFWSFTAGSYSVGSSLTSLGTIGSAITDTGTTLMFRFYSYVAGAKLDEEQGGYVFPCDAHVPSFVVDVGGLDVSVRGELVNYAPTGESGMCFGGIQPSDGKLNIFGDVFLKAVYVVFDLSEGTPRLGFGKQA
ncbi:acid protease [Piedraia hortae CBS 480.64]|uniref:Acid protease n=1 Tax=Piedraia hortae CBS 480.64 TaxID=1314780 RepID=A0A6A7C8B2_9PEZI|nr:acid protease [Piedraia hortae CBS 480.64]